MKRFYITRIAPLVLASVLLFYSCQKSFLNKPVTGALSVAVLSTPAGLSQTLVGAYAALQRNQVSVWDAAPDNWIYGTVAGGDAHKGSNSGDQAGIDPIATGAEDPSNGFFNSVWLENYEGVTRANSVLKLIPQIPGLTPLVVTQTTAEAKFLRAHFYFELRRFFKMVPYVDEKTVDQNQPNTMDIYPQIEADFAYAYANLAEKPADIGRVNKWAAASYLAKVYMYEKKFAQAKALYDVITVSGVNSGGIPYGLLPKYEDNFYGATKNNMETVFSIQQVANDGTNSINNSNNGDMLNFPYNSPFRCCGFLQPTQELANSFRTDATGLPLIYTHNDLANLVKNDQGVAAKDPFTPDSGPLDPRIDWTMGRRGIPYLDWGPHPGVSWIRDQPSAGPYSPIKNVYYQSTDAAFSDQHLWAPGTANPVNIIRYADVLLMAAEAEAQIGSLDKAESYVNMVRARAANPISWAYNYKDATNPTGGYTNVPAANYVISVYPVGYFSASGQTKSLDAVYFERKIELAMEGHRFFDLARWGLSVTMLNAYFKFEGTSTPGAYGSQNTGSAGTSDVAGATFTAGHEYFPIPQAQIDLSTKNGKTVLKQIPPYPGS